MNELVARARRT